MKRVLHVINTLEVGGGATHLLQLASGLTAQGFESVVIAGDDGPATGNLRALGAPVEVLGTLDLGKLGALATRFERHAPDLLHLHGSRSGFLGAIAARRARVRPVVYTAHMFSFRRRLPPPFPWLAERAEAATCRVCQRVICVSESDRREAERRRLAPGRIVVVPNGIEMSRFPATEDRRRELDLDPTTPVVGMIGRLVTQKDPIGFVRMAATVRERVPEASFVVAGDGPLRSEVEAHGRALGGRLRVLGFRSDVPELLATLDVVVFPSRWEAQGIGLVEAMAAGRAVVATRLPPHAEVVVPGENGLLVPAGDPGAMADAVAGLLPDADRRGRLGRAARRRVEQDYRVERMVESTADVYRRVLASRSAFQAE